jgi:hypothetical protein
VSFLVAGRCFALANAGVAVQHGDHRAGAGVAVDLGHHRRLVVGKFVGITAATAIVRATGLGALAPGLTLRRVAGGAALSGIGFTISLFIVDIAITDPVSQDLARVGVLVASLVAFVLGWLMFTVTDRISPPVAVGATLLRAVDPERDHIVGNPNAPLTLVEYADFECAFCSRATGSIDEVQRISGTGCATCGGICRWNGCTRTRWTPPGPPRPPPCRAVLSRWVPDVRDAGHPGVAAHLPLRRRGRLRYPQVRRGRAVSQGDAPGDR